MRLHAGTTGPVVGTGTERRAVLIEKGWSRRRVVVNGVAPSDHARFTGHGSFDAVGSVGRELFAADEQGAHEYGGVRRVPQ